jgi:small subunit ribosomal protein S15
MLTRVQKKKLINQHAQHERDTGSPKVQVAILTVEIDLLAKHLQEHPKDHSARRGLLGKVAQRRRILNYLKLHSPKEYEAILDANKLKK